MTDRGLREGEEEEEEKEVIEKEGEDGVGPEDKVNLDDAVYYERQEEEHEE